MHSPPTLSLRGPALLGKITPNQGQLCVIAIASEEDPPLLPPSTLPVPSPCPQPIPAAWWATELPALLPGDQVRREEARSGMNKGEERPTYCQGGRCAARGEG